MSSRVQLKNLLKQSGFKPNKLLGQNFLTDQNVLKKILAAADLTKEDTVLEIGPGIGTLTFELARQAGRVLAVEKDKALAQILKKIIAERDIKNVEVVEKDILKINISTLLCGHSDPALAGEESRGSDLPAKALAAAGTTRAIRPPDSSPTAQNDNHLNYKVVANIPYYLTSHLIRLLLEGQNRPTDIILMLQKEVAQRICASPPEMSVLALSVQFYARPKIISYVSKNSFWPSPKVDSAILKITPRKEAAPVPPEKFFKLIKAGFSAPRKQLAPNLVKKLEIPKKIILDALQKAKIDQIQRAETLSLENWLEIIQNLPKL